MLLSNKVYDTLKWMALFYIPVVGTFLYFLIVRVFGLSYGKEILTITLALVLLLGTFLRISADTYTKSGADGILYIEIRDLKDIYRFQFNDTLENLAERKKVTFIVDAKAKISD